MNNHVHWLIYSSAIGEVTFTVLSTEVQSPEPAVGNTTKTSGADTIAVIILVRRHFIARHLIARHSIGRMNELTQNSERTG